MPEDDVAEVVVTVVHTCESECKEDDARRAVEAVFASRDITAAAVTVVFADDEDVSGVHGEFFDDPTPTDVMTFPMGGDGTPGEPLSGEIMVGAEHARRVAGELGRDAREEAMLYVVHGAYHLCGMDDRTPEGRAAMRLAERDALQSLGVVPHYFD